MLSQQPKSHKKEIEDFVLLYNKEYESISTKETTDYILEHNHFTFDGGVFVYLEFENHIYNSLLLFDVKQVKNPITSYKQFRKLIKDFKRPVFVTDVRKEFRKMAVQTARADTYRWKH